MIITSQKPFTKREIQKLRQEFDVYIKTVIDIETGVCSAGANRHFESEAILLKTGSKQENLWGGGLDLETKTISIDSMINIRPKNDNRSNEIQDPEKRGRFEELTRYFFKEAL